MPAADRGQTQVTIELPPGSTLAATADLAERSRVAIMQDKNIVSVFSSIGGGSSGDAFVPGAAAEARRAILTVTTVHRNERRASLADIDKTIRERLAGIPGARFNVGPPDTGVKMQLVLKSDDTKALIAVANAAEREMRSMQGIGNVSSSAQLLRPEINLRPDMARAAELGVTTLDISETVRVASAGDYDFALSKLNLTQRQVPIPGQITRFGTR